MLLGVGFVLQVQLEVLRVGGILVPRPFDSELFSRPLNLMRLPHLTIVLHMGAGVVVAAVRVRLFLHDS